MQNRAKGSPYFAIDTEIKNLDGSIRSRVFVRQAVGGIKVTETNPTENFERTEYDNSGMSRTVTIPHSLPDSIKAKLTHTISDVGLIAYKLRGHNDPNEEYIKEIEYNAATREFIKNLRRINQGLQDSGFEKNSYDDRLKQMLSTTLSAAQSLNEDLSSSARFDSKPNTTVEDLVYLCGDKQVIVGILNKFKDRVGAIKNGQSDDQKKLWEPFDAAFDACIQKISAVPYGKPVASELKSIPSPLDFLKRTPCTCQSQTSETSAHSIPKNKPKI